MIDWIHCKHWCFLFFVHLLLMFLQTAHIKIWFSATTLTFILLSISLMFWVVLCIILVSNELFSTLLTFIGFFIGMFALMSFKIWDLREWLFAFTTFIWFLTWMCSLMFLEWWELSKFLCTLITYIIEHYTKCMASLLYESFCVPPMFVLI